MTEEIKISSERFFQRLERLQAHWFSHKNTAWGGADGICFPSGSATGEETTYSKSASISLYLFGYEFPDSIMLITQKGFYFMAAPKKCGILEKNILNTGNPISVHIYKKEKDDGMNRENFHNLMNAVRTNGGKKLGMLIKGEYKGNFVPLWMKFVEESHIETCEVASALGLYFVTKDDIEQVIRILIAAHCFRILC